jgi:hypothetical protein
MTFQMAASYCAIGGRERSNSGQDGVGEGKERRRANLVEWQEERERGNAMMQRWPVDGVA